MVGAEDVVDDTAAAVVKPKGENAEISENNQTVKAEEEKKDGEEEDLTPKSLFKLDNKENYIH